MMLAHSNIEYDDEAIWGAEFQRRKLNGEFPWDKLPVLQLIGGGGDDEGSRTVAQSGAIARWSA